MAVGNIKFLDDWIRTETSGHGSNCFSSSATALKLIFASSIQTLTNLAFPFTDKAIDAIYKFKEKGTDYVQVTTSFGYDVHNNN